MLVVLIPRPEDRDSQGIASDGELRFKMANGLEIALPIALRIDFDASAVRAAARRSKDGGQIGRAHV